MLKDLIKKHSIIHIAGREYRVRYSLNALLCLEMLYKPLDDILKTPFPQWSVEDVVQLAHAAMCCLPKNFKAVNRRDFENIRPTVAELGELISIEDLPVLRVELIAAIIDSMPQNVNQEADPNAVEYAMNEGHQRAMYVDVMHRPEGEYWSSTNKEITERIDYYLEASGQKEAPIKVRRYGEARQGEESI